MARKRNKALRSRCKRVLAELCKRENKQPTRLVSSIDRDIDHVRRSEIGRLSATRQHIPRNAQWCGIYPGHQAPDGFYKESSEHPEQCQIRTHQSRTSYKGRAPSVSYTIEPGKRRRKRIAKPVPVPVSNKQSKREVIDIGNGKTVTVRTS